MFNFKNAALLVDGITDVYNAKTASSLIRYKNSEVLCYISSSNSNPNEILGSNKPIINVLNSSEIKKLKQNPDILILCLMLPSGQVPPSWIQSITYALENNIDIINPFHFSLADFQFLINKFNGLSNNSTPQITIFNNSKSKIFNIRVSNAQNQLLSYRILEHRSSRVLTIGTDCNIGKMLTTISLNEYAKNNNFKSSFVATGQIGILIKGSGVCVDRIVSDFLPGVVEDLVIKESEDNDFLFIEGQGSLFQPMYAPVTLGLLHGSAPHAMILCHSPLRKHLRYSNIEIPDLKTIITYYEQTAAMVLKAKVLGLSLNTYGMDENDAKNSIKYYEDYLNIPVNDPIKFGVDNLFKAINITLKK